MPRIQLNMTIIDAISHMSDGNPGALNVLCLLTKEGDHIDPDGFAGGFGAVMMLDTLSIYGSRIWLLYKDVCGSNLRKVMAILRAFQFGFLASELLSSAIDNRGRGIDIDDLCRQVKEKLPNFQLEQPVESVAS